MKSTGRGLRKGRGLEFLDDKGTKLSGTFCIDVGELSDHGSKLTYVTKNTYYNREPNKKSNKKPPNW